MNRKQIAHPVTPYEKEYTRRQVLAMHPSMQRQVLLDHYRMSVIAQTLVWNNPERTIANWVDSLP